MVEFNASYNNLECCSKLLSYKSKNKKYDEFL